jgi:aminoglycoside phosphotransferase (APT) family kinase protein
MREPTLGKRLGTGKDRAQPCRDMVSQPEDAACCKHQPGEMLGETRQRSLLNRLAALPDGDRLCHYDFHPLNILGQLGREVLIDWPNASHGDPAADICRSYVLIRTFAPDMASAFVDAHVAVSGDSRARILSWLPFVAAARVTESVPNEVDALMEMAASG